MAMMELMLGFSCMKLRLVPSWIWLMAGLIGALLAESTTWIWLRGSGYGLAGMSSDRCRPNACAIDTASPSVIVLAPGTTVSPLATGTLAATPSTSVALPGLRSTPSALGVLVAIPKGMTETERTLIPNEAGVDTASPRLSVRAPGTRVGPKAVGTLDAKPIGRTTPPGVTDSPKACGVELATPRCIVMTE